MTVIATIISKYCCAHASDSLITEPKDDGTYKIIECRKTKIVLVRQFSGAMAYWGLALCSNGFSTLEWLGEQAEKANQFENPEEFANHISKKLNDLLSIIKFENESDKGIGIHFTAYEIVEGVHIPELFAIRNFKDLGYKVLLPEGVQVSRNTFDQLPNSLRDYSLSKIERRLAVYKYLEEDALFLYNNGDPEMFNPAANAIFNMFRVAADRHILKFPRNEKSFRKIVQRPIYLVSEIQKQYVKEGHQLVGGEMHNLSITPTGKYDSDTDEV
jgi:hypothetical protein